MEKSADEIFEELGYTIIVENNKKIQYEYKGQLFDKFDKEVTFKLLDKKVVVEFNTEESRPISIDLLQAINKKVEELRMALKIRDNVNLKELEKFGFVEDEYVGDKCWVLKLNIGMAYDEEIVVWNNDKEIQIENAIILLNVLYDLIQADLVEKVSD